MRQQGTPITRRYAATKEGDSRHPNPRLLAYWNGLPERSKYLRTGSKSSAGGTPGPPLAASGAFQAFMPCLSSWHWPRKLVLLPSNDPESFRTVALERVVRDVAPARQSVHLTGRLQCPVHRLAGDREHAQSQHHQGCARGYHRVGPNRDAALAAGPAVFGLAQPDPGLQRASAPRRCSTNSCSGPTAGAQRGVVCSFSCLSDTCRSASDDPSQPNGARSARSADQAPRSRRAAQPARHDPAA